MPIARAREWQQCRPAHRTTRNAARLRSGLGKELACTAATREHAVTRLTGESKMLATGGATTCNLDHRKHTTVAQGELAAAALPPAGAQAGQHTVGIHLSDCRVLSVMLVFESPTSMFANRFNLSFM